MLIPLSLALTLALTLSHSHILELREKVPQNV